MKQLETTGLEAARERTSGLVSGIEDEDLERVHSPLMSPLVWDLGHIAAFEDLWLAHRHGGLALLRPDLMQVYDAFETPRADRGSLPYLRVADALEFMDDVRRRVRELPVGDGYLHELVARHESQHNETMLQTLNLARISRPGAEEPARTTRSSGLDLVGVPGGSFPLGAETEGFSYDNERPAHPRPLRPFRIGRVPVTNGDWLHFVADGGYARREWWSPDGWAWRAAEGVERPLNWVDDELEWRLADGAQSIDALRPVIHVSWYEADAFARSRGLRLPSEAEWEAAATWDGSTKHAAPGAGSANLAESGIRGATAVGSYPEATAPCGALGLIGDVWEWTASTFRGYPGFIAHPYPEYSEVFFGSEHRVLRGGSFATSASVVTPTFRNWDYPHRRQIFAGLRVAADA